MLRKTNDAEYHAVTSLDNEFLTIRFEREEIEKILQHTFDARDFTNFVQYLIEDGTVISWAKNLTDLMKELLPNFENWKVTQGL
ncbi:MAG: hypothetical protein ACOY5B_18805 [Spirochaetota bacterium]